MEKSWTEYKELKERITEGMLNFMEERFPGYKDMVAFKRTFHPLIMNILQTQSWDNLWNPLHT